MLYSNKFPWCQLVWTGNKMFISSNHWPQKIQTEAFFGCKFNENTSSTFLMLLDWNFIHLFIYKNCKCTKHSVRFHWYKCYRVVCYIEQCFKVAAGVFLCPRHSKNGGGALSVTPVRACIRPSVIKIWCPLNNLWKTASIQF